MSDDDIRVVVGLDFGTTYSGFTYCHVSDKPSEMCTNDQWPGDVVLGLFKTNTVLQYDENLDNVELWGNPALFKRPSRRKEKKKQKQSKIVELFKLHLGNLQPNLREELPVDYKKAIADYFREIGKLIKETVETRWCEIDFFENVRLVLTVPAEFSEKAKAILRECVYKAELINDKQSKKLQFTTEPEAAAIYCKDYLREHDVSFRGTIFMIVDCGGGTVDLTTRKLLSNKRLGEITERAGDYCGSTFIDREFIKCLEEKLGKSAIDLLRENHYGHLQFMVQEFCEKAKLPFTGDDLNFSYELDLEDYPVLKQYISDEKKDTLEDDEWLIKFDYNTIKSMFDPVIDRIFRMIHAQLDNSREKCSIMFLVGGFSESKYLQKRIRQEFQDRVDDISVPADPVAAISRGAAIYGLSPGVKNNPDCVIDSRVLNFTYGIELAGMTPFGFPILYFHRVVKRGSIVKIDEEITVDGLGPCHPSQSSGVFEIYYTREYEADFCDDPGMNLLGRLRVDMPDVHLGLNRTFTFKLTFGKMEIAAAAINDRNGQNYQTFLEIDE